MVHFPSIPMAQYSAALDKLRRLVERARLKGQIKGISHIFRRTFAAHAVRQGVPRPHIQATHCGVAHTAHA